MKHGFGTYSYANGDKYCGQWEHDQKNGTGSYLIKASQTQVTGRWVNGVCEDGVWEYFEKSPFFAVFINNKVKSYFPCKQEAEIFYQQQLKTIDEKNRRRLSQLVERLDMKAVTGNELYRLTMLGESSWNLHKFDEVFRVPLNKRLSTEEFLDYGLLLSRRLTHSDFSRALRLASLGKSWMKTVVGESKNGVDAADGTFPDCSSFDLYTAARVGSLTGIKRLASSVNVLALDRHGKSALTHSTLNGHVRVTRFLLEQGAKWDAKLFAGALSEAVKGALLDFPRQKVTKPPPKKDDDED